MASQVKEFITQLANKIPIEWDRVTLSDGNYYVVYGWINRPDGKRDFVSLEMEQKETGLHAIQFVTSSAKYSKEIMKAFFGTDDGHSPCIKIDQLQ